jgi:hypothetical protein
MNEKPLRETPDGETVRLNDGFKRQLSQEVDMIWTKNKPTMPGYYWLKMDAGDHGYSEQPPRVVKIDFVDDGNGWGGTELYVFEGPDFDETDGFDWADASEHFDWSSEPINLPADKNDIEAFCKTCFHHEINESGKILCLIAKAKSGEGVKVTAKKERLFGECGKEAKNYRKVQCGCRELGSAACSSCDSSIPLPA